MASKSISQLTPTTSLNGADLFVVNHNGTTNTTTLNTLVNSILPPGIIMAFASATVPAGWLECNGQSTASYPTLAALVGANVPDLRGEFVRGWDNGRGIDTGRRFGSNQTESLSGHTHTATSPEHTHSASISNSPRVVYSFGYDNGYTGLYPNEHGGDGLDYLASNISIGSTAVSVTVGSTGGTETRPRNVALMYIIKT